MAISLKHCNLGKHGQAFRANNENSDSVNKGNYLETLNGVAIEEGLMKDYLKSSNI